MAPSPAPAADRWRDPTAPRRVGGRGTTSAPADTHASSLALGRPVPGSITTTCWTSFAPRWPRTSPGSRHHHPGHDRPQRPRHRPRSSRAPLAPSRVSASPGRSRRSRGRPATCPASVGLLRHRLVRPRTGPDRDQCRGNPSCGSARRCGCCSPQSGHVSEPALGQLSGVATETARWVDALQSGASRPPRLATGHGARHGRTSSDCECCRRTPSCWWKQSQPPDGSRRRRPDQGQPRRRCRLYHGRIQRGPSGAPYVTLGNSNSTCSPRSQKAFTAGADLILLDNTTTSPTRRADSRGPPVPSWKPAEGSPGNTRPKSPLLKSSTFSSARSPYSAKALILRRHF